jgi:hypothetical protein
LKDKCEFHLLPNGLETYETCLFAVNQCWVATEYIPLQHRTRELCQAALSHNWHAWECILEDNKTYEMCLSGVKRNLTESEQYQNIFKQQNYG